MVTDALSHKFIGSLKHVEAGKMEMNKNLYQLSSLRVWLLNSNGGSVIIQNTAKLSLIAKVKELQYEYLELVKPREGIQ